MDTNQQGQIAAFGQKHRTGLVTLVFTDLVGSTALKQALGDREALARSRDDGTNAWPHRGQHRGGCG